jgi:hypothetical protein
VWEHSISLGAERHWELDDNIRYFKRRQGQYRLYMQPSAAIVPMEDFVDRYANVGMAGPNYTFFSPTVTKRSPFTINAHVYSCMLIWNDLPFRWRLDTNEDVDLNLLCLANGWATIQFQVFLIQKNKTLLMPGGNTDRIYQGNGRLTMAKTLERLWPGVVSVNRRFGKPQHMVRASWRKFNVPLILKDDVDLKSFPKVDNYGVKLKKVNDIRDSTLKQFYEDSNHA